MGPLQKIRTEPVSCKHAQGIVARMQQHTGKNRTGHYRDYGQYHPKRGRRRYSIESYVKKAEDHSDSHDECDGR